MSSLTGSTPLLDHLRHTLAHLLAHAVQDAFPRATFAIGPTIADGFYYDFGLDRPLTPEDLKPLEKRMKHLIKQRLLLESVPADDPAVTAFIAKQPFKQEMLRELDSQGAKVTFYHVGKFIDLCRGGHVANTGDINPEAFTLTHVAGAYWRGDSTKPMLQRIYGLAFATKEELDAALQQQAEAKKRDHKILGPELDLFTFSELVGGGLPLWTPRGTLIRDLLDSFVWELRQAAGYERVDIPLLTKKDLYEKSGHWQKFHDELFQIKTREGHLFAMKPMNCPHHTQIYARKQHSYRELPQRYVSTTKVYRDEQTGELSGLVRVRAITQDDAHVFCRQDHVVSESRKIWKIVKTFYRAAGFQLDVRLSLRDPTHPEKYLGDVKRWNLAEATLRQVVKAEKAKVIEAVGEAAFYGPKIDFLAKDSLGREWQVATIQLDMVMPERFDLVCTNEKGDHERIIMIHTAIMGSLERYLAILIEHFAGAFPLWLAPVQIQVLTVAKKHQATGRQLFALLHQAGVRVYLDDSDETVGYKIRQAEKQKVPYMIVVGDKEKSLRKLAVRVRGKKQVKTVAVKAWLPQLQKLITARSLSL